MGFLGRFLRSQSSSREHILPFLSNTSCRVQAKGALHSSGIAITEDFQCLEYLHQITLTLRSSFWMS